MSRGDLLTFVNTPISATFVGIAVVLLLAQVWLAWRRPRDTVDPPIAVLLEET